jgi:hypothetical protein
VEVVTKSPCGVGSTEGMQIQIVERAKRERISKKIEVMMVFLSQNNTGERFLLWNPSKDKNTSNSGIPNTGEKETERAVVSKRVKGGKIPRYNRVSFLFF